MRMRIIRTVFMLEFFIVAMVANINKSRILLVFENPFCVRYFSFGLRSAFPLIHTLSVVTYTE